MDKLKKKVSTCVQRLSLALVWRELEIFSKLLYRGRNQHRRDKSFQKLLKVSKDLKRYQDISLPYRVKKLHKSLPESGSLSDDVNQKVTDVLDELVECAKFISQLLEFIEVTYQGVDVRLRMSLFIPFNLLMISSLSRMWYCLNYHLEAISETFSLLTAFVVPSKEPFPHLPSLVECLPKQHKHYLQKSDCIATDQTLGTVVIRTDCVDENAISVPSPYVAVQAKPQSSSPAMSERTHTLADMVTNKGDEEYDIMVNESDKKWDIMLNKGDEKCDIMTKGDKECNVEQPHVIKRKISRKRYSNTIVGVIKVGLNIASFKMKCPKNLFYFCWSKSQRSWRKVLRINNARVFSVGHSPWGVGYTALKYNLNFIPWCGVRKRSKSQHYLKPSFKNSQTKISSTRDTVQMFPENTLQTERQGLAASEPSSVSNEYDIDDIFSSLL